MTFKMKRTLQICLTAVLCVTLVAALGLSGIFEPSSRISASADDASLGTKYYSAFDSFQDEQDEAAQLNAEMQGEGMVLLKNNSALPLKSGERKITLFGVGAADPLYGAQGSGTNSVSAYQTQVTLVDGFEDSGIKVNNKVLSHYSGLTTNDANPASALVNYESSYTYYGGAGVIVITREGGEGESFEFSRTDYYESASTPAAGETAHGLMLNPEERALVDYVTGKFDKVIVLLNTTNPMELGELEDNDKVDAVMWIGTPGVSGFEALGKVFTGEINPSGRTADTYPADFTQDPAYYNYGDQSGAISMLDDASAYTAGDAAVAYDESGSPITKGSTSIYTVTYGEGIYEGYRWYETQAELTAAGSGYYVATADNMPVNAGASYDVNDVYYNRTNGVVYPFGYGISYTEFEWSDFSVTYSESARTFTADVTVKNTGSVAGKDVVEVYYAAPYIDGGIEKASANLVRFAKTDLLDPGESQKIEVEFEIKDMASFDYNDANCNGSRNYELDPGDYVITLRTDSHNVKKLANGAEASYTYTLAKEYVYDGSDEAHNYNAGYGDNSEAIFSEDLYDTSENKTTSGDWLFNCYGDPDTQEYISRAGGSLSLPEPVLYGEYSDNWVDRLTAYTDYNASQSEEFNESYGMPYVTDGGVPSTWTQADTGTTDPTELQITDMVGVSYQEPYIDANGNVVVGQDADSQLWETFLNQLTFSELYTLVGTESDRYEANDRYGKPYTACNDGPSKIQSRTAASGSEYDGTWWVSEVVVASMWNTDLAYLQGYMIGNESLWMNVSGFWGFGLNTHRGQWGARNFEYYSEDGILAGYTAAYATKGATDMGVIVYNKHFALNDQDEYRNTSDGCAVFLTEQAFREIYLKPYELGVKVGGAKGFMCSFMRIGAISSDNNYNLLQKLARGEWGFKGDMCSDATGADQGDACSYAGCDWPLLWFTGDALSGEWDDAQGRVLVDGDVNNTQWFVMRRDALHSLWVWANSNALKNCIDFDAFTGDDTLTAINGRSVSLSVAADLSAAGAVTAKYVLTSGSLPDGLTLSEDGTISGTTTEVGTYTIGVKAIFDGCYQSSSQTFTITVERAFELSSYTGTLGDEDFEIEILMDNLSDYDSLEFSAEGLPAGLYISSDTGLIYGTPTEAGTFEITITAKASSSSSSGGGMGGDPGAGGEMGGGTPPDGGAGGPGGEGGAPGGAGGSSTTNFVETFTIVIEGENASAGGSSEEGASRGVAGFEINSDGDLVVTYTDGTTENLGRVVGSDGTDGKDGTDGAGCDSVVATDMVWAAALVVVALAAVLVVRKARKEKSGR